MKNLRIAHLLFVSMMALPIAFTSCGGGDEDPIVSGDENQHPSTSESIKLRRTSIENGAIVKANNLKEISLYYNNTVTVSPTASITLNGKIVSAATSEASKMEIVVNLGTLAAGTSYTLNIPSGSIIGIEDNTMTAPDFTLTFTTEEAVTNRISALTNKNATPEAKNVYNFLKEMYGQKQLSGVQSSMSNTNDFVNLVYSPPRSILPSLAMTSSTWPSRQHQQTGVGCKTMEISLLPRSNGRTMAW